MQAARGKILVIRGGAIGDFILTLPVLSALRQHFPQVELGVLGYPHIAQLALAGGLADEVRSIEAGPLAGFFARNGALNAALKDYFADFAIIISFLYDPDGIFQTNVARCSKAQFIAGPHRPDEMLGGHASNVFLRVLERLAIFEADAVPRLSLESRNQWTAPRPKTGAPLLSLHPGSGSERKNWPEAKWAELLRRLVHTTDAQFLMVGGEAEEGKLTRLTAALPAGRTEVARNLPLPALAQRLTECDAFIGHDSGITHLAAAVGLPMVVLWGDSVEEIWRPRSETLSILKDARGLAEISPERVLQEIVRLIRNPILRVPSPGN